MDCVKRVGLSAVIAIATLGGLVEAQTPRGTGPADKLATAFNAALDQLGTPKTTTAAKR
jgi:hypothetical protein